MESFLSSLLLEVSESSTQTKSGPEDINNIISGGSGFTEYPLYFRITLLHYARITLLDCDMSSKLWLCCVYLKRTLQDIFILKLFKTVYYSYLFKRSVATLLQCYNSVLCLIFK